MKLSTFTNNLFIKLLENATDIFRVKKYYSKQVVQDHLPLALNRSGFLGKVVNGNIVPLKNHHNVLRHIPCYVEGTVILPQDFGLGQNDFYGNGLVEVPDSSKPTGYRKIYDGRGGTGTGGVNSITVDGTTIVNTGTPSDPILSFPDGSAGQNEIWEWTGTQWELVPASTGGMFVDQVTATSPLQSSGGQQPDISLEDGTADGQVTVWNNTTNQWEIRELTAQELNDIPDYPNDGNTYLLTENNGTLTWEQQIDAPFETDLQWSLVLNSPSTGEFDIEILGNTTVLHLSGTDANNKLASDLLTGASLSGSGTKIAPQGAHVFFYCYTDGFPTFHNYGRGYLKANGIDIDLFIYGDSQFSSQTINSLYTFKFYPQLPIISQTAFSYNLFPDNQNSHAVNLYSGEHTVFLTKDTPVSIFSINNNFIEAANIVDKVDVYGANMNLGSTLNFNNADTDIDLHTNLVLTDDITLTPNPATATTIRVRKIISDTPVTLTLANTVTLVYEELSSNVTIVDGASVTQEFWDTPQGSAGAIQTYQFRYKSSDFDGSTLADGEFSQGGNDFFINPTDANGMNLSPVMGTLHSGQQGRITVIFSSAEAPDAGGWNGAMTKTLSTEQVSGTAIHLVAMDNITSIGGLIDGRLYNFEIVDVELPHISQTVFSDITSNGQHELDFNRNFDAQSGIITSLVELNQVIENSTITEYEVSGSDFTLDSATFNNFQGTIRFHSSMIVNGDETIGGDSTIYVRKIKASSPVTLTIDTNVTLIYEEVDSNVTLAGAGTITQQFWDTPQGGGGGGTNVVDTTAGATVSITMSDDTETYEYITLTQDTTITINCDSLTQSSAPHNFIIRQDATGGHSVTWAVSSGDTLEWYDGAEVAVDELADGTTLVSFYAMFDSANHLVIGKAI